MKKKVRLLFEPEDFISLNKVEYKKLNYNKKLDSSVSVDEIKKKIADYVEVVDEKDCFMIYYEVKRGSS